MGKTQNHEISEKRERETLHRDSGKELVNPTVCTRVRLLRVKTKKSRGFGNSQATQTWLTQKTGFHIQSFSYSKFWS